MVCLLEVCNKGRRKGDKKIWAGGLAGGREMAGRQPVRAFRTVMTGGQPDYWKSALTHWGPPLLRSQ